MFEQAVDARLFLLIKKLAGLRPVASGFYLAVGTALALQLGHRKSDDIDLFSQTPFNSEDILQAIAELHGRVLVQEEKTVHALIEGVKASFIFYPYKLLSPLTIIEGLNVAGIEDIACMKAVAISQRAEKKDFFDMYELLKIFKPTELKEMFLEKYGHERINCYHILRSFFFFEDADASPDPVSYRGVIWDDVKNFFRDKEKELTSGLLC